MPLTPLRVCQILRRLGYFLSPKLIAHVWSSKRVVAVQVYRDHSVKLHARNYQVPSVMLRSSSSSSTPSSSSYRHHHHLTVSSSCFISIILFFIIFWWWRRGKCRTGTCQWTLTLSQRTANSFPLICYFIRFVVDWPVSIKAGSVLEIIASLWRENPSRDLKTELFVRTV